MSGNGIDQPNRESERVPIEAQVGMEFESFQGFLSEYSANISMGGMFVRAVDPPPVGTLLRFTLKLKGDFKLIQGRGEVVWNRTKSQGAGKPPGAGIRFLELEPASADLIRRMVDRYRVQGGEPFDLDDASSEAAEPKATVPRAAAAAVVKGDLRDDIFIPPSPAVVSSAAVPPAAAPPAAVPPAEAAGPPEAPPRRRYIRGGTVLLVLGAALAGGLLSYFGERLVHWATGYDQALAERVVNDIPPPVSLASEPEAAPAPPEPKGLDPAAAGVTDLGPEADQGPGSPLDDLEQIGREEEDPPAAEAPAPGEPAIVFGEDYSSATEGLNRIRLITWKESTDGAGTVVTLWGNGNLRREDLVRVRLGGSTARELVKLRGVDWPFRDPTLDVNSSEVRKIRTGFHPKPTRNELHVVFVLEDSDSRLRQVELGARSIQLLFD